MNIQIYGTINCFDTKKAERYFKERRIKYQFVDLKKYGVAPRELELMISVLGLDAVIDKKSKDYENSFIEHLARREDIIEKLFENPSLIKTPIVRDGRRLTVGVCPDVWKMWE